MSQHDLAEELNDLARNKFGRPVELTKKTVGRWERGEVAWPQPFYRRLLAEHFRVAADELGFLRPRPGTAQLQTRSTLTDTDDLLRLTDEPAAPDPRVVAEQDRWRQVRQALGLRRRALAVAAESLYPDHRLPGCTGTGVIADPSWIPAAPIPLEHIVLDLLDDAPRMISGIEPDSAAVRPLRDTSRRYRRYSHAIRDLARPSLFENRLTFRLLDVDWSLPDQQLSFGTMGFFDGLDVNEALAHETAQEFLARNASGGLEIGRPSWRRLAFRKLVADPFDLRRRPMMGAIGTLTVRGGDSPSVVLHARDGLHVAGGGSMIHLLPAGIFQPSSVLPESVATDFSVWRNMQREFAEEVLGHDEYDGTGAPVDYDRSPFADLDAAVTDGRLRAYCLGVTLDALTLAGDILTVVVLDPDLHDRLFADSVDRNTEGTIPARRIPFERNTIDRLSDAQRLSPGAAAALHLAWQHRDTLLGGGRTA
ncbi:transcriptional regulator [Pseudonocardia sp. P1]